MLKYIRLIKSGEKILPDSKRMESLLGTSNPDLLDFIQRRLQWVHYLVTVELMKYVWSVVVTKKSTKRLAMWLNWLTISPDCFYQRLFKTRHRYSKCPKASVFAGFFCFNVGPVFIFLKVGTHQRRWLQVRLSSMARWRRLCWDACPHPQETHQKLVEYHFFTVLESFNSISYNYNYV